MNNVLYYNGSIVKQVLTILFVIIIGAVVTYWIDNKTVITIFYISLLVIFYFSQNNTFWIALFFILISGPFGLFVGLDQVVIYLTPKSGFRLPMFVAIICFLKYLYVRYETFNYAQHYYTGYGLYYIVILIVSVVYEITLHSAFYIISGTSTLAFFYAIPLLLNNEQKFTIFNKIVFAFSIIFTIHVFADIALSGKIINILAPGGTWGYGAVDYAERELVRQPGGGIVALYALIMSLYYLSSKSKNINSIYMSFVAIMSALYIFNSATRGWIIAILFLIIFFLLFEYRSSVKYSIIIIIVLLTIVFMPPDRAMNNLILSYERLLTIGNLVEGDETAGGTLIRLSQRAPRVMTHFHKNPITGFGLSKITDEYGDTHVGNHNLLLRSGIVGFTIVYLTLLLLCLWVLKTRLVFRVVNPGAHGLYVIVIGFAAVMIIHSTSREMINYPVQPDAALLVSLLIAFVNSVILDSERIIDGE